MARRKRARTRPEALSLGDNEKKWETERKLKGSGRQASREPDQQAWETNEKNWETNDK